MATPTVLVRDEAYEGMSSAYQCLLVAGLDAALIDNGIADPEVRQRICEHFLFWHGNLHDQGWLKRPGGEPFYPLLCFSRKFLNIDTALDHLGPVFAAADLFSWHEFALGNVGACYANEPDAAVETGCVGDEPKP